MASTVDYLEYVLDLLREVKNVRYKKMMGEYLLYANGKLFGGIYDNRFLLKKTAVLADKGLSEELPYEGAKKMYLVDTEDAEEIADLVQKTISTL